MKPWNSNGGTGGPRKRAWTPSEDDQLRAVDVLCFEWCLTRDVCELEVWDWRGYGHISSSETLARTPFSFVAPPVRS